MAGEIIIYRRCMSCKSLYPMTIAMQLYSDFLMAIGPRAPVMERVKLDLRYVSIKVSGARIPAVHLRCSHQGAF